ncbi:type II toxin-antitoxin system RelE/ParE family toxin [Candidatus Micrarchaeota archaeon]|nr:type II toxin-antitoxin system RelE/ParE family toxin [Candidatus Micrarchaeota archaeon]
MEYSNNALKYLKKAEPKLRERMHLLADILMHEPVPAKHYDVLKLSGSDGYYRIRLSSHRVQYFVDWDNKKIQILDVERRDENTYRG